METLTERNLDLEEKVRELRETVTDLVRTNEFMMLIFIVNTTDFVDKNLTGFHYHQHDGVRNLLSTFR